MNRTESIRFMKALRKIKDVGISVWAIYTHAFYHTQGFENTIGRNNFWGVIKPNRWPGLVTVKAIKEYDASDAKVVSTTEFADWETIDEALAFYLKRIEKDYDSSWKCKSCAYCFLFGLEYWDKDSI